MICKIVEHENKEITKRKRRKKKSEGKVLQVVNSKPGRIIGAKKNSEDYKWIGDSRQDTANIGKYCKGEGRSKQKVVSEG